MQKKCLTSWRYDLQRLLRKGVTITLLVALVAGLIPPPLVHTVLPPPVAELVEAAALAAPLTQVLTGSNVLTITKTVVGSASTGPFNVTVTGPGGYNNATTVSVGSPRVLTGLASGVYTVTESSPGAGWTTTYTATAATGSGSTSSPTSGVVTLSRGITATATAAGQITGIVYNDYNSNGVRDTTGTAPNYAIDGGVSGVTVMAYDRNGALAGTATTAANGGYTLNTTASGLTGPYRLEFTNLPSGYESSRSGADNGSSTQFSSAPGTNVNFAVARVSDYCQNNPLLCTPVNINGDATSSAAAMYALRYDGTGQTTPAQQNQIGGTWGLAYKGDTKQLFAAAFVQRHVGLGALGLGGIYTITGAGTASPLAGAFVDLESAPYNFNFGTLPNNATRGLPANVALPSQDPLAFAAAGREGIGDIDLTEDGKSLWVVNLYTATSNLGSLIKLDVSSGVAGAATQYPLASMSGLPTCSGGVLRPWALKFANSKGYLGAVCSAESSQVRNDLKGYVLSFNPNNPTATTIELTIPLTYTKGEVNVNNWAAPIDAQWYPWLNTYSAAAFNDNGGTQTRPTPLLADIEFDSRGGMTLGFGDRAALQASDHNYAPDSTTMTIYQMGGELLRACQDASGIYVLENAGSCGGVSGFSTTNNKGPGGGEWYNDDSGIATHQESNYGGVAQLPGANDVVLGGWDPVDTGNFLTTFDSGGFYWTSNVNGAKNRSIQLWNGNNGNGGFFGKGNGQGDIELLCDAAPLEIGNRVWNDINGNGIQDPGEPGLNGITVSRQGPTNTVTTLTSGDGNYYFAVNPNTAYTLTFTPPSGYSLTQPNAQALAGAGISSNHAISDTRDSDAVLVGGLATIYYTTGSAGQNNHGLDFGFTQPVYGRVGIVNTYTAPPVPRYALSKKLNTPDPVRVGQTVSFTIRITNTGSSAITVLPLRDQYNTADLQFLSASPATDDTANDGQLDWSDLTASLGQDLAPTQSFAVTVNFLARRDTTGLAGGAALNTALSPISPTLTATAPVRVRAPTGVALAGSVARYTIENSVALSWATVSEAEIVGFHLLRWEIGRSSDWLRLNPDLIPAQQTGQAMGATYTTSDLTVEFGRSYLYLVEIVGGNGETSRRELGLVTAGSRILLPLVTR